MDAQEQRQQWAQALADMNDFDSDADVVPEGKHRWFETMFRDSPPTDQQKPHLRAIRAAARNFLQEIKGHTPQNSDKRIAIMALQTVVFWAYLSISNGPE